jgi:hypothetical protein
VFEAMSEEEGRKKRSKAKDPPRTTTNEVARNSTEERTASRSHTSSSRDEGTRNATESLNQMEQDVLAKSRASAGRVIASVDPPTSVAASNTASRGSVLNQLESEIWAKNQSRAPSGMTSTVGAKAVYSEPSSLTAKRGNSGAKTSAGDAQHTKGVSGPTIATAVVAGVGTDSSGALLRNLEQEIANKTAREQTRSNQQHQQSSSRLQRMEDEINAKSRSFQNDPGVTDKLRSVEEDILAKHVARESNPSQVLSSKYNADAHEGSGVIEGTRLHDASSETFNDESDHKKLGYDPEITHIQDSEGNETTNVSSTSNFNSMGFSGGQMYPDYLGQETAPVMLSSDIERGAGIEAFVAEHAVVDATGVAVVPSTEEEEMLERKRMRLYMCIGCLVFVLLAVGIVVAVLMTVGSQKQSLKDIPTSAPSEAPSMVPSAAPTSLRFDAWLEALKAVSSEEALADKLSPQYQAALWISDGDKLQLEVGSKRGIQRYSLAVFYFSTNGDKWVQCGRLDLTCGGDPNNFSWLLETKNECDWLGVNCDTTNTYVTSIFFPRQFGNGLVGTIPPEILNLSSLEALILHRNQLMGSLPSFLGKLKKLQVLFLLGNQFQGAIPDEIFTGATLLGTIHLGQNMLTGTVPPSLGSLPMRSLRIGENSFTGEIPAELGNLSLLSKFPLLE